MARGGHHGGSSHSGGHHSGGGHFGGGGGHYSGGGGFSGGGHYSGGGYSGGGSSGGGGGYFLGEIVFFLILGGAYLLISFLMAIADGAVPGLNLVNLGMFILSGFIFFFGLRDFDRTFDLIQLRKYKGDYPAIQGKVWNGLAMAHRKGDKRSSVGKYTNEYRISFSDPEYGVENARKVKETMNRTPKILWINPFMWLVIGLLSFASTFFFYEAVIPYFERMIMTDIAFWFIDELVFYLPSIITLLCAIATEIIKHAKDNILHKCAERIVNDIDAYEARTKTEEEIKDTLSKKWYHNSCPNCGAPASSAIKSCLNCGSSLEVISFESGTVSGVHRVSEDANK